MFIPKSIVCLRDYSWRQFRADLNGGIVVGLVALAYMVTLAMWFLWPKKGGKP